MELDLLATTRVVGEVKNVHAGLRWVSWSHWLYIFIYHSRTNKYCVNLLCTKAENLHLMKFWSFNSFSSFGSWLSKQKQSLTPFKMFGSLHPLLICQWCRQGIFKSQLTKDQNNTILQHIWNILCFMPLIIVREGVEKKYLICSGILNNHLWAESPAPFFSPSLACTH